MSEQKLNCPKCGVDLEVDSIRKHQDGRVRVYWECTNCHISIMDRGEKND